MKHITTEEVRELFRAQGVERDHFAFKRPMCGTVQSMASLAMMVRAALDPESKRATPKPSPGPCPPR